MKKKIVLQIIFFTTLICCKQLPKETYYQWQQDITYEVANDSFKIIYKNSLKCPIRVTIKSEDSLIQKELNNDFPKILAPDTLIKLSYPTNKRKEDIKPKFYASMGNPNDKITVKKIELPFPKNKRYKIIQGYNGNFSHQSEYSKFAIDFNLSVYDTISAVAQGYVVGVIENYKDGRNSKKWRNYANFITIFHPEMNIYTQYVHLTNKGSFVKVGDRVESGQSLGLSGKTGFTSIAHLHFNVLKPSKNGMESIPIEFIEGYKGSNLKKGDFVEK